MAWYWAVTKDGEKFSDVFIHATRPGWNYWVIYSSIFNAADVCFWYEKLIAFASNLLLVGAVSGNFGWCWTCDWLADRSIVLCFTWPFTGFFSSGQDMFDRLVLVTDRSSAWINNHTPSKVSDEIIYSFPNFNGATVEVWEWVIYCIPHFIMDVITYPCWDLVHNCWNVL